MASVVTVVFLLLIYFFSNDFLTFQHLVENEEGGCLRRLLS